MFLASIHVTFDNKELFSDLKMAFSFEMHAEMLQYQNVKENDRGLKR